MVDPKVKATRPHDVDARFVVPLAPTAFTEFFRDVHGYEPFPWQQRLTAQVIERGSWPSVIDLPTGTGKTAVLDTAIFLLALRPETAPRRVVFVVDRRIVVDQVLERAIQIRDAVEHGATPVLLAIKERLRDLSGGEPLGVARLRGGIPLDKGWTQRPDQPWVLVSTVDQFGSRLLFRGYGVSPGMRPVHAGLAGNDCLVILDEVHLSAPFAETLGQVAKLRRSNLPRRFAAVEMSATPTDGTAERFTLDTATDLEGCDELRRRVNGGKAATIKSVRNQDAIPQAVLNCIASIGKSRELAQVHSVGVIVNRVRTARETHDLLASNGYTTHLITGRMRPLDRVDLLNEVRPIVDPDGDQRGEGLAVVVATQAIEVGADFSFDAIVVECAAIDSLRQRFGRLDRRGTYAHRTGRPAPAWIIGAKSVVAAKKPDPIYGESARSTWEELERRAKNNGVDVGTMSLRDFPADATAPRLRAPLLLKTHMDSWVQTRPEPLVQPFVDEFLHGIGEDRPAEISILWRWDRTAEVLRLVPPRQAEFLQVPIAAVRSWLSGGKETEIGDVPHAEEHGKMIERPTDHNGWVRWNGHGEPPEPTSVADIRPGDILVVDPKLGGLRSGNWDPSCREPVDDLGDAAQIAFETRATLRLDLRLSAEGHAPPLPDSESDDGTSLRERIEGWLDACRGRINEPDWRRKIVERLSGRFEVRTVGEEGNAYYVLIEKHDTGKRVVDTALIDGSDETNSFTGTAVLLDQHLEGVGARAARIANRLGMPADVVDDIRLAGRMHDLGKVDRRFQLKMVGGHPVELELRRDAPLAKSLPQIHGSPTNHEQETPYPKGMRHELASVAMIQSNLDVLDGAHDKDLVLHLVGSHHGWCRPLPPVVDDPHPQSLNYQLDGHALEANSRLVDTPLALEIAERFWQLVERYSYYGLAWLESILRLADHQQSAEEARRK